MMVLVILVADDERTHLERTMRSVIEGLKDLGEHVRVLRHQAIPIRFGADGAADRERWAKDMVTHLSSAGIVVISTLQTYVCLDAASACRSAGARVMAVLDDRVEHLSGLRLFRDIERRLGSPLLKKVILDARLETSSCFDAGRSIFLIRKDLPDEAMRERLRRILKKFLRCRRN